MYKFVTDRQLGLLHNLPLLPTKTSYQRYEDSRIYCLGFSFSSSFLFKATQGSSIKFYKNVKQEHDSELKVRLVRWTITDYHLNLNENFLAYTSMMPIVQMTKLDPHDLSIGETSMLVLSEEPVALFCVRFSGNSTEIVAGGSDACIYIYDLEANRTVEVINAHDDDVNSVCFVNPLDSNVVVSASDDCTIKIWDRRCIKQGIPSGILLGHSEVFNLL
jgi:WD repeat-containing protein 23